MLQGGVGQGIGGGLQGFQNGHTGGGQHGQGAGKTRRVVATCQATDQRQSQPSSIELATQRGLLQGHAQRRQTCDQQRQA